MIPAERREQIRSVQLPELARFSEPAVTPGEAMDIALATTARPIHLITTLESAEAAKAYRDILGRDAGDFRISVDENPIQTTLTGPSNDEVRLVMHSATDPVLFRKMFADGPHLGQLLMAHVYQPSTDHESPRAHCIGATKQSLDILAQPRDVDAESITQEMRERRKELLGETLSNEDFRRILQSDSVKQIKAHALGPAGTNISQAMAQYLESLGVSDKSELIIHNGPEPREYAEMARTQVEDGVIPIHMECAVFYDMLTLFNERPDEVVFADHHDMLLDAMQLASIQPAEEILTRGRYMRIATHPSPRPLVSAWTENDKTEWIGEWIKATSNAAAAQMVLNGEADLCVTTGSGLAKAPGLTSRHVFGNPNMFFTIGTPLNQEQLQSYLTK